MKLTFYLAVALLALSAAVGRVLADAGHVHEEQRRMLEQMREMHGGHDHAHDFGAVDEISQADMRRTIDLMTDLGLVLPSMDSKRGREVFLQRGCIVCHSINGAGGEIGPSLDAADMPQPMNAFEFAARMWRGAPVMAEMQEDLLGEMITLTGQDLADILAFAHDESEQAEVTSDHIPERYQVLIAR